MSQNDKAISAAGTAVRTIDPTTVVGWGIDADPKNDPTWPMRDRSGDDGRGMDWTRPPVQTVDVEILQSVEHQRRPAVIGVSTPPSGVSGILRRQAFRLSESQWGHWLLLILADRVNSVEGLFADVGRGRMPNPLVEMGLVKRSHARPAAIATAALAVLGVVAIVRAARPRR